MNDHELLNAIQDAFRREPRLGPDFTPEKMEFGPDGALTVIAEVESVAAKKRALELAAAPEQVRAVVDRVRVAAATQMKDRDIYKHLREFFCDEPAFRDFAIFEAGGGPEAPVFTQVSGPTDAARGRIDYEVHDGVVILNGTVPGLVSQRLAGAMAWWVPGVRDVVNSLQPDPPEEDAPIRIEEAARIVLDRDPYVDDTQIRIGVRGRVVRLTGIVRSPAERAMAEADCWSILGVDDVINDIKAPAESKTETE
ncbi:BON domain-containing protein [Thalassovita aquimarina]|uniref:BON domain-containing protein n=1 Tax=Thalassovita aquimarina TaxID=2785917 RepID=A0ABS5HNY3_9RHOB|nr:BON domain-containing protein [Thalassovita aquimarina]MBR9650516.1 BON domain-containing protein [Thalassovita aquimarina]